MSKKANYMYLPAADLEIDLRNDTAIESVVRQGYTFHKADGTPSVGTDTGGGSSELFEKLVDKSIEGFEPTDMENITKIGRVAFADCQHLTDIEIPSNIEIIRPDAFQNSSITSVRINEGCEYCDNAFAGCDYLTTAYLPSTLQSAMNAFESSLSLSDIYYNSTKANWDILNDGDIVIAGLTQQLTVHCTDQDVVYNEPVGNMVVTFSSSTQLPPSEIPVTANVTVTLDQIAYDAGTEPRYIRTVTFPEGVESICEYFAAGCSYLSGATFPSTLKTIGSNAFARTNLASIDLPASIERISDEAFANLNRAGGNVEVTCRAPIPPYLGFDALNVGSNATLTDVFVQSASVTDYQQDTNWSQYASIISAIV